jgi:hypothetical protein
MASGFITKGGKPVKKPKRNLSLIALKTLTFCSVDDLKNQ